VYLLLSVLDFPFSFLTVRYLGAEKIGELETKVGGFVKPYWISLRNAIGYPPALVPAEAGEEKGRGEAVHDVEGEAEKAASMFLSSPFLGRGGLEVAKAEWLVG